MKISVGIYATATMPHFFMRFICVFFLVKIKFSLVHYTIRSKANRADCLKKNLSQKN